jgi:hypothetical protein
VSLLSNPLFQHRITKNSYTQLLQRPEISYQIFRERIKLLSIRVRKRPSRPGRAKADPGLRFSGLRVYARFSPRASRFNNPIGPSSLVKLSFKLDSLRAMEKTSHLH